MSTFPCHAIFSVPCPRRFQVCLVTKLCLTAGGQRGMQQAVSLGHLPLVIMLQLGLPLVTRDCAKVADNVVSRRNDHRAHGCLEHGVVAADQVIKLADHVLRADRCVLIRLLRVHRQRKHHDG